MWPILIVLLKYVRNLLAHLNYLQQCFFRNHVVVFKSDLLLQQNAIKAEVDLVDRSGFLKPVVPDQCAKQLKHLQLDLVLIASFAVSSLHQQDG
jgi:hypothetical protein